ncbi:MAG: PilN domain-containing protein [Deltaproteobacteria bacterium]|nr:PilN domain-containing protein [Deltaproteobacteria bacterium]
MIVAGCGGARSDPGHPEPPPLENLPCKGDASKLDASAVTGRVPTQGRRIALQIAAVWCEMVNSPAGAQIQGDVLVLQARPDVVRQGQELAEALRAEPEARAGEPFVCRGARSPASGQAPSMGGVQGQGISLRCPEPLETRVLRMADPYATARAYCDGHASPWGIAGVVADNVIILDFAGNIVGFQTRGSQSPQPAKTEADAGASGDPSSAARRGLVELARILTPGVGPTRDPTSQDVPASSGMRMDPAWDARRVGLSSYVQHDYRVRVTGAARSAEDVAEFMRRIAASVHFSDVVLQRAQASGDSGPTVFELTARARDPGALNIASSADAGSDFGAGIRNPFQAVGVAPSSGSEAPAIADTVAFDQLVLIATLTTGSPSALFAESSGARSWVVKRGGEIGKPEGTCKARWKVERIQGSRVEMVRRSCVGGLERRTLSVKPGP